MIMSVDISRIPNIMEGTSWPGIICMDPENFTESDLRYLDKLDKLRKDMPEIPKIYPCQWAEY